MTTPHSADVVIAGGGIGGLATALSLHAAGIRPLVLESSRRISPLGVGINLQPAAVRELHELGLADELAALGVPAVAHVFADHRGTTLYSDPRGTAAGYRWPQYSVHRGDLQMMLLRTVRERIGPEAVRTGVRVEDFTQTPDAVEVHALDRATDRPERHTAGVLVAADGIHSRLRARLHPGQGPLRWSGVTLWRGVTETDAFPPGEALLLASDERDAQFVAYQISPAALARGRTLLNWVCAVPTGAPGPLPAGEARWNRPGRLQDVLPHYADWHFDWTDLPGLLAGAERILEYPMVDRDPLPSWGAGRVTLLGDAAHPAYPSGANGGSQAVLDARVLAHRLATEPDPVRALAAYEAERRGPTAAVVLANRKMDSVARARSAAKRPDARRDLERAAASHRRAAGEAAALNTRASYTPPART
ncbi:FAD-dependent monooxygenase [Streptomyces huiliensis]|uniref:FAD-dependent monooxygenase n=1 Tax=Streptomyces huiliensis TaxID=2876027 RepID=UPI001CBEC9A7|nr:FAD-dependent monooxygenase [Streptomyces huiliensis]MBZ4324147.1 FAD-dependent monooxygenase [Streptomyces huiliensis]